jgi:ABC-2 type transport system ATP-binding protein
VEIRNLIKEISAEKTIILSTHILAEVEATCDRVLIMHRGKIAADSTLGELHKSSTRESAFEVQVEGAPADDFKKKVAALSDVTSVTAAGNDRYTVHVDGSADVGGGIFDLAVSSGWRLRELSRRRMTLEMIFQKLTSDA